jgi:hypothetical protein
MKKVLSMTDIHSIANLGFELLTGIPVQVAILSTGATPTEFRDQGWKGGARTPQPMESHYQRMYWVLLEFGPDG